MSTFPSIEAALLEIHQSFGCKPYQTKPKKNFAAGQDSLAGHAKMGDEVLQAIFDALKLDPQMRVDFRGNMIESGNVYKFLELNTWTFNADPRQILWMLLGRFFVPRMARRAAFWSIPEPLDKDMPSGQFWYLPYHHHVKGAPRLHLPVAQVVDWLLDLLGLPLEEFADKKSEASDGVQDGLRRTLYNWRKKTTPDIGSIQKYFSDKDMLEFNGVFNMESTLTLEENFALALKFTKRKGLDAGRLREQIPMTQEGRLEAVLSGNADEDEKTHFVHCLTQRYAEPSMRKIRQRLLFARMMQDGYTRLLKFLCPGTDILCVDAGQNKVLQLVALYKLIYNLTLDAWGHCNMQGEEAEDEWFENNFPSWLRECCISILPSQRETGSIALAEILTRFFEQLQPGQELEDHLGYDETSLHRVIKRNMERMKALGEEGLQQMKLAEQLKTHSAWRVLQNAQSYWIVNQITQKLERGSKARRAATQRLKELANTPSEKLEVILCELDEYMNPECKQRPKDARASAQALIDAAKKSPAYELWEAPFLHIEAKHLLNCNDFESATRLMREALEAGRKRCYGPLRSEVSRDLLATAVSNNKLIPNNHEKYYREILNANMVEMAGENGKLPCIEEVARAVYEYYWDTLYKPYAGIPYEKPLFKEAWEKICADLLPLFHAGDIGGMKEWIKTNKQLLTKALPNVEGNSVTMNLIKGLSHFRMVPDFPENTLANWRQFIGILASNAPAQLNIADLKRQTPLMLMAEAGDTELVKIMLEAGADPDMQDWQGMTALHSAVKSHVKECVDLLLDHPCRLDLLAQEGQSPLHTAAWSANLHAMQRLLELAPQLAWQRNEQGMTPLELIENLIDNPHHLQALFGELRRQGRQIPTQEDLDHVVRTLENAPVPNKMVTTE